MTFKKLSASLLALGMTALTVAPMATSAYEIIQEKTFEHVDLNGNPYNVIFQYICDEEINAKGYCGIFTDTSTKSYGVQFTTADGSVLTKDDFADTEYKDWIKDVTYEDGVHTIDIVYHDEFVESRLDLSKSIARKLLLNGNINSADVMNTTYYQYLYLTPISIYVPNDSDYVPVIEDFASVPEFASIDEVSSDSDTEKEYMLDFATIEKENENGVIMKSHAYSTAEEMLAAKKIIALGEETGNFRTKLQGIMKVDTTPDFEESETVSALDGTDINGDGKTNVADLMVLAKYISEITTEIDTNTADINFDGKVDASDMAMLATLILKA